VKKKLILIDGNSLIHRAYHALPPLETAAGEKTQAVYGFTTMLLRLLKEEKPDYVAVAFDKGRETFRTERYALYKAQRDLVPEDLLSQFALTREVLAALEIPYFEVSGFEADDILGTLAAQAEDAGLKTLIVTGDRDALQLVKEGTEVLLTRRGITDLERLDAAGVRNKLGVTPSQVPDFKALTGDASDNIPGVPGIGPKTAAALLNEFSTLESLYAHLSELKERWQKLLGEYKDQVFLSRELATIRRDVPLTVNWEECRAGTPVPGRVEPLFRRLEFQSLLNRLFPKEGERVQAAAENICAYERVDTAEAAERWATRIKEAGVFSFLIVPGTGTEPAGLAIAAGKEAAFVPWELSGHFRPLFEDAALDKITHDVKAAINTLASSGFGLVGVNGDTLLAGYLLNPTADGRDLPRLAKEYLGAELPRFFAGRREKEKASENEGVFCSWVRTLEVLWPRLVQNLKTDNLWLLYHEVELPLAAVLAEMERTGIKVDKEKLSSMGYAIGERMTVLEKEIFGLVGEEFNLNSPKQLAFILFDKLGLPATKKTKTGYSTDAEVLEELAAAHPAVPKILEHRQLAKLKSTYVDAMGAQINPATGRIHTTFTQTVTATGRLSSVEPNLQNIPIRLELGRRIREAFVPGYPGWQILAADYSQIELRVLAHIAQDPVLQESFQKEEDIHARTAAEIFHVPLQEVTPELRSRAKAVNFGIVYGISEYGLAQSTGVSRQEAREYIENYLERYQGVREYMKRVVEQARLTGYVTTILGRRRYLPDISSRNFARRSFAERTALNTPIQGSAADIIKVAMLKVDRAIKERNLASRLLLQVHDELVFEVPPEEISIMQDLVREHMEKALELSVPLKVDIKIGPDWYHVEKV
jgi:DNA polymerase-1